MGPDIVVPRGNILEAKKEIMNIIAHRGYWKNKDESNTLQAFKRAIDLGFGIETDFRDLNGELVIAHDPPTIDSAIKIQDFLDLYATRQGALTLAMNIKADGLQQLIIDFIQAGKIESYFVFDMSFPDMRLYAQKNINFYTRLSEFEPLSMFNGQASGIWVDSFEHEWLDAKVIK
jgi:glycerophosphoryl diester phosphodiesterase